MMAMPQFLIQQPAAIWHALHGTGRGIPVVEVAHEADGLGLRRLANEIHRTEVPVGAIAMVIHGSVGWNLESAGPGGWVLPKQVVEDKQRRAPDEFRLGYQLPVLLYPAGAMFVEFAPHGFQDAFGAFDLLDG